MLEMKKNHFFDEIIERRNTNSIKYDFAKEKNKPQEAIPLWVADMDFRTAMPVTKALMKAVVHGIYGYSESKQDYFDAIYQWYQRRFGWECQREWLVKTPGVVFAIATAIRALTREGDAVLIQQPVYYPFSEVIKANHRLLINNPLMYVNGSYQIDFKNFEEKIIRHQVKLFILCSPHNPVGRVWTKEELIRLGDICIKHGVIIISDEIHGDFTYRGYQHHVFSGLKEEFLKQTILCTAPSKTFNLAGLQVSNVFIADQKMRRKFKEEISRCGYSQLNQLGLIACQAAYQEGEAWLEELLEYLQGNLDFIRSFIEERLPKVRLVEPEGTYLVWLDFQKLHMSDEELDNLITQKAKLWLDAGTMFGEEGRGFQRINIACPRSVLKKALEQLEDALQEY